MNPFYVALDIGGTKFIVGAADDSGRLLKRVRESTPGDFEEGMELLERMIADVTEGGVITGMGAAIGGPMDWETGVVSPLHQPNWRNVPFRKIMEERWQAPLFIDVDTNVAALAEYECRKPSASRLLYITVSTGMGGGLIIDGKIYRGMSGAHPEVAHQFVSATGPQGKPVLCSCGAEGCLEELVSGNGIRRTYGKKAEDLNNDEWRQVSIYLGHGLRNLATIYLPDIIVLGGGVVFGSRERLLPRAVEIMRRNLKIVPCPQVEISTLGEENVLQGAAILARRSARPATL
jgi:glucokinase